MIDEMAVRRLPLSSPNAAPVPMPVRMPPIAAAERAMVGRLGRPRLRKSSTGQLSAVACSRSLSSGVVAAGYPTWLRKSMSSLPLE